MIASLKSIHCNYNNNWNKCKLTYQFITQCISDIQNGNSKNRSDGALQGSPYKLTLVDNH